MRKKNLLFSFLLVSLFSTVNAQFKLAEDFSGTTFPPTGWSRGPALDDGGVNPVWRRLTPSAYEIGSGSAFCYFFKWSSGTDSLTSAVFAATGSTDTLYFDHAYRTYSTEADNLKVFTSTDGGGTWTLLQDLPGGATVGTGIVTVAPGPEDFTAPTAGQWATKKYLLAAGINRIKFQVTTAYGNNLFIDNVKVGKPAAADAAALNTISPSGSAYSTTNTISFTTNNTGTVQNNSAGVQTFTVTRKITPGSYTSTQTVTALAAGATRTVTFDPWNVTFVDGTTYTIKDSVTLAGDATASNDASSATVTLKIPKDILIVNVHTPSRDSLVAHLTAAGIANKYDESTSFPNISFGNWKTLYVLFGSTSNWSATLRDSLKAYLDNANNPSSKRSLAIFGNDLAYNNNISSTPSTLPADTIFLQNYLRAKYIADSWLTTVSAANKTFKGTSPMFGVVIKDSVADPYPDLVKPVNGGLAAFVPFSSVSTDSCNAVYYEGANYKVFYGTNVYSNYLPLSGGVRATRQILNFVANSSVLPVSITSVKAYQQNAGVFVDWSTQSEINMQGYEVEKSKNGVSFDKAGSVTAKSGSTNNYSWFDTAPYAGDNYYRIKTIGLNGEIKYTAVVRVNTGKGKQDITVYPNPVKGNIFNLSFNNLEKGNYTVNIYSLNGQVVTNKVITHNGGSSTQSVLLNAFLPAGLYEIKVTGNKQTFTQALILE